MGPYPRALQKDPDITFITVKPVIWDKWCDGPCAYWEPSQEPDDFRPRIALVVCYSPFQDLPQDNLRDKKTISMSLVYVPEHWILPSFMEAAYVVNRAQDAKDIRGMMSLARIHKRSPFYPDISFWEYKQHLMIMPLIPPTEDGLGYCGYTENFAVGALHRRPDCFCKAGEMAWAPPAFRKAPLRELVLITGNGSKNMGVHRRDTRMSPGSHGSYGQLHPVEHHKGCRANTPGVCICLMFTQVMAIS